MNASNNQIETIECYLNKQLSPVEIAAFENKIAQDPAFAAEVMQHRLIHELIADRGLLDVKQKMQDSRYDHYFDQPKGNNYWHGGLAIGLLLLSVASYVWYTQPAEKTVVSKTTSDSITTLPKTNPDNSGPITTLATEQKSIPLPKAAVSKPTKQVVVNAAVDETIQPAIVIEQKSSTSITDIETNKIPIVEKIEAVPSGVVTSKAKTTEEKQPQETSSVIQKSPTKTVEYAFSPSLGQVWDFPIEENANCKLTILNKSGQLVYESNILNGYPNSWNGTSNRSISITMGSYIYLFEYQNGQVERGYVTVTQ